MNYPPRWVFDIWKNRDYGGETLRICGTEKRELQSVIRETEQLFDCSPRDSEKLVAVAWALYISEHDEGVLNEKTKFAFAGFLKAGAGHVVAAQDLIANLAKQYHAVVKHPQKRAVIFALKQFGFVE